MSASGYKQTFQGVRQRVRFTSESRHWWREFALVPESRHSASALPPNADVIGCGVGCPLLTHSGHSRRGRRTNPKRTSIATRGWLDKIASRGDSMLSCCEIGARNLTGSCETNWKRGESSMPKIIVILASGAAALLLGACTEQQPGMQSWIEENVPQELVPGAGEPA